ncbi:hypothetical protein HKX48_007523 [Thoreauomyces humboldtii]|nr:hypothetical protein HKX48_007523 [Thoreauomyces humboldtii]
MLLYKVLHHNLFRQPPSHLCPYNHIESNLRFLSSNIQDFQHPRESNIDTMLNSENASERDALIISAAEAKKAKHIWKDEEVELLQALYRTDPSTAATRFLELAAPITVPQIKGKINKMKVKKEI